MQADAYGHMPYQSSFSLLCTQTYLSDTSMSVTLSKYTIGNQPITVPLQWEGLSPDDTTCEDWA